MAMRVLIADDHQMFRQALLALLGRLEGVQIVGQAEDGRDALRLCRTLMPDLVVLDIGMKNLNGIEAAHRIRQECPDVKILAVSMHADRRFVSGMIEAGATGYVLKDCAFDELHRAIAAVSSGKTYFSAEVAQVLVQDYCQRLSGEGGEPHAGALSSREREVLQLFAEGKSTKEIAGVLHVSVKTIETHRKHVMDKLNLHTIAQLTKWAVREGLTAL